jgi:hypothetical protein
MSADAIEFAGGQAQPPPLSATDPFGTLYIAYSRMRFFAIDQDRPGGFRPVCSRGTAYSFCDWSNHEHRAFRSRLGGLGLLVRLRRIPRRRGTGADGEAVPEACVAFSSHRAKPTGNQPSNDAVDGVGGLNGSLRWEGASPSLSGDR